jgi:hypothetical protein
MNLLIVDAQGGGIGKRLVSAVKEKCPEITITAVGTNSTATASMLKAGAHNAATGENAVKVNSKTADIIAGPVGIVIADSLLGEITPGMALAVGSSTAKKLLIPINHCDNVIIGIQDISIEDLIKKTSDTIFKLYKNNVDNN